MTDNEVKTSRNGWKVALAVLFLLLLGAASVGYWYKNLRGTVRSDDARIDGDLLDIAAQMGGSLRIVTVKEGDSVEAGQLLFSLDDRNLAASMAKAKAAVRSAQAALDATKATYSKGVHGPRKGEIKIAQAVVKKALVNWKLTEAEWSRVKALHNEQVMTKSSRDRVRTNFEAATHALEEARTRLSLLKQGTRKEDLAAAKANVDLRKAQLGVAEAGLEQVEVNMEFTKVYAPFSGIVVRTWQKEGAILSPGRPVLTLLDPETLSISANIEEKHLSAVSIGDVVDITIDAYPNLVLEGRLDRILRATNSKFSLIPAEGVTGAYIKVAQRIPIRITVKSWPDLPLGPGLSVEIRIHVSKEPGGFILRAAEKRP